jgi:hypothetical protein
MADKWEFRDGDTFEFSPGNDIWKPRRVKQHEYSLLVLDENGQTSGGISEEGYGSTFYNGNGRNFARAGILPVEQFMAEMKELLQ